VRARATFGAKPAIPRRHLSLCLVQLSRSILTLILGSTALSTVIGVSGTRIRSFSGASWSIAVAPPLATWSSVGTQQCRGGVGGGEERVGVCGGDGSVAGSPGAQPSRNGRIFHSVSLVASGGFLPSVYPEGFPQHPGHASAPWSAEFASTKDFRELQTQWASGSPRPKTLSGESLVVGSAVPRIEGSGAICIRDTALSVRQGL
jgi:hypothetical protein